MVLNRPNQQGIAGQTEFIFQEKSVIRRVLLVLTRDAPRHKTSGNTARPSISLTNIGQVSQCQYVVSAKKLGCIGELYMATLGVSVLLDKAEGNWMPQIMMHYIGRKL